MVRALVVVASLGLPTLVLAEQQPSDPSLQIAFGRLATAWATHDAAALDALLDANFLIQHADGRMHVKLDELEHVRSGEWSLSPRIDSDDDVQLTQDGTGAARHYTAQSGRVTELWRRLPSGAWVLVAHFEGFGKPPVLSGLVHA
jgi:hypothetical protein